jgi:uracil-DNA glycosylase
VAKRVLATYHPSAILRAPDLGARRRLREDFTADLRKVARELARPHRQRTSK